MLHRDGVSFPDFPGCITAGRTLDEAKDMALEALSGHIEVTREAGETVPLPRVSTK
jgi:predicted RNase H-like HicB family nuclease